MEGHNYVICKLTKLIECKSNSLELVFLEKFQELSSRYDKDIKLIKEALKQKFEKTNRHIDESVFTVLNKSHRFECDLEKIYKKLVALLVQPNQQNIAKCLYLKDQKPGNILDLPQYVPPECKCIQDIIPCSFDLNKAPKCCCHPATEPRADEKEDNVCYNFITPEKGRKLLAKKPKTCIWKNQSPIAITNSEAIPINMPAIEMIGFHNLLPAPIKLQNSGHAITLSIRGLTPREVKLGEFLPCIMGGKLCGQYVFKEIQFHWGSKNYMGTQHVVDDVQYVMEMNIVFTNKKYKDYNTALGYADGIVEMAIFYRISDFDEPEIGFIVENIENLQNIGDIVEMDRVFPLCLLLGNMNLDRFYMYKGSLIRAPHSEVVTWIVFPDPLKISNSQIEKFRKVKLCGVEDDPKLYNNFRDLQPLGNRRVFLREGNRNGYRVEDLDRIHHSKWQWYNN